MSKMQYAYDKDMKMMQDRNIAFASGKGGTGKTTIAVNLAYFLSYSRQQVQYLDCDVEEPNGHIFLKPKIDKSRPANVLVPAIDKDKCTSCGECSAHCQFNALVTLPKGVLLFPELCHGCGLCIHICPERAIRDGDREVGLIEEGAAAGDIDFIHGVLNVGEPMAVPLIQEVKRHYREHYIRIIDAPPGTSCPVVKTISDADVVVMVTEPTPFGLHDLKIAVSMAKSMGKPIGVVINRQNGEFPPLDAYLSKNDLPVIMALPEDREIARHYSMGKIFLKELPGYIDRFMELAFNIGRLAGIKKETRQVKEW